MKQNLGGIIKMKVIKYFSCNRPEYWLCQIGKSDWCVGQYLYELLSQKKLTDAVGENAKSV